MIPWGVTVIAMLLIGRHSDKTGERSYHIALPVAAGGLGLAILRHSRNPRLAGADRVDGGLRRRSHRVVVILVSANSLSFRHGSRGRHRA